MSTITKERVANLLQFNSEGSDCQANAEQWEIHELARIALASLELERGMIRRFDLDMSDCDSCGQDCGADMVEDLDGEYVLWDEVLPHLYRYDEYTIPPAPVSVPAAYEKNEDFSAYHEGWNACRDAMLQGADGNSPVILDGWVACSERMPETMVSVLVTGTCFRHAVSFWDGAYWCDLDFMQPVTHWQPLPAAPQQEVKL